MTFVDSLACGPSSCISKTFLGSLMITFANSWQTDPVTCFPSPFEPTTVDLYVQQALVLSLHSFIQFGVLPTSAVQEFNLLFNSSFSLACCPLLLFKSSQSQQVHSRLAERKTDTHH
eukprot:scaffold114837_cov25-Tisochrysis_lutea.AAC.1